MNKKELNNQWYNILIKYSGTILNGERGAYSPIGQRSVRLLKKLWETNKFSSPNIEDMLLSDKKIAFFSDIHFKHSNIIRLCNRPFFNIEDMDSTIWTNLKESSDKFDFFICLGDLSLSNPLLEHKKLQHLFKDKYVLLVGNHDAKGVKEELWCVYGAMPSFAFSLDKNFIRDKTNFSQVKWDKIPAKINFGLSHWPIINDFLPYGWINIHGHTHNRPSTYKHINVSIEQTAYKPVAFWDILTEEKLIEIYTKPNNPISENSE